MPSRRPPKLKPKNTQPRRDRSAPPPPLKLGDVLGQAIAADRAEKERRAELNAMGFTPIKSPEGA